MQAIEVKYIAPTNSCGARLKAIAAAGSVTIAWPYEYDGEKAHLIAAMALCDKFGWNSNPSRLIGGQLKNGNYVFCLMPA